MVSIVTKSHNAKATADFYTSSEGLTAAAARRRWAGDLHSARRTSPVPSPQLHNTYNKIYATRPVVIRANVHVLAIHM